MASWSDVRRAIYWADKYLDNLYTEISWNGKTYGIMRTAPPADGESLPLILRRSTSPTLLGPGASQLYLYYDECYLRRLGYDRQRTTKVLEVRVDDGEIWEGSIQYGYHRYIIGRDPVLKWSPICTFDVRYEVDNTEPSRMKVWVKLKSWDSDTREYVDAFFNGNLMIQDLVNNVGAEFTVSTSAGFTKYMFPVVVYWPEETLISAHYYWQYKLSRSKALNMVNFLDDYGYTLWRYLPLFLGTRDDLPDDFLCRHEVYKTCDYFTGLSYGDVPPSMTLPKNEVLYPHFSETCICREATLTCRCKAYPEPCRFCVLGICQQISEGFPGDYKAQVAIRAVHLLNKYRNPDKPEAAPPGNTARDYLMNGFKDADGNLHPPLTDYIKSILYSSTPKFSPFLGPFIAAYSILGYGFGVEEARKLADDLVDFVLPSQWGFPFTSRQEMYGRTDLGIIRRPDHTGGFLQAFEVREDGNYYAAFMTRDTFFREKHPRTLLEGTLSTVLGLRIYEYYKWRLKLT